MKHAIAVGFIILLFVVLSIGSALRESLTFDEIVHMQEGINHLILRSFAIDTNNPPFIRELAAIPLILGAERFYARLIIIVLGAILVALVYKKAPLAAFLLALEPTYLAHSHYVTLDVGFTLFFYLAYLAFANRRAIVFGALFGLAAASKVSAWPFIIGIALWFHSREKLLLSAAIALLVIWATYFFKFDVVIARRDDPSRLSAKLETDPRWQRIIFVLKNQPLPLGNYLATIKNNMLRAQQSKQTLLLPYNFLLKTPLPLLFLLALFFLQIVRHSSFRKKTRIVWIPIVSIFFITSVSGQEPWARYLLPAYPFVAIAAALEIKEIWERREIWGKFVSIGILLWFIVGTLVQYPHFISYANELAGPRERRFEKLMDSNLDWGQALPDFARFAKEKNPTHISFSYFGRDNGNDYGLISTTEWGSYKFEEICAFHEIPHGGTDGRIVAISATNWYQCGYKMQPQFQKEKIKEVVADSILIF